MLGTQGTTLYASTGIAKKSFYVSSNAGTAGATWSNATGDLGYPGNTTDDATVGAFALKGTHVIAGAGLLFDTANDGVNWTVIADTPSPNPSMIYTTVNVLGADIFAGAVGGMLVSHDGGTVWATSQMDDGSGHDTPWADGIPVSMNAMGSTYFVGVEYGSTASVWSSTDHGDHWTPALDPWFKDGVETQGVVMIQVNAHHIRYWDASSPKLDMGEIDL